MAQMLLINAKSKNNFNEIGDVVVFIEDDVPLSKVELENFDIIKFPGIPATEMQTQMVEKLPEMKIAWKDGSEWKELEEDPVYQFNYKNGEFIHNYGKKNTKVLVSNIIKGVK